MRGWRAAAVLPLLSVPTQAADDAATVAYGCDDLVVVGRVRTLSYTDLSEEGDVLGHGRFALHVHVTRRLRGRPPGRYLAASRIGHSRLRHDRSFLMVLSPAADGYEIEEPHLWYSAWRPSIAPRCGTAPSNHGQGT